jgi:hypothetical protein
LGPPLTTRLTVWSETPASSATSLIVTVLRTRAITAPLRPAYRTLPDAGAPRHRIAGAAVVADLIPCELRWKAAFRNPLGVVFFGQCLHAPRLGVASRG